MTTNRVLVLSGAVLLVSILIEVLFVHPHVHYWWHGFVGFDIIYGFLGCLVLIGLAKSLGKLFIQREENYYDGGEESND